MEELEKYLNKCYLESDKEFIFVYKFVKVENIYGFLCYEVHAERGDISVSIYEDFPVDQDGELEFIRSFIPELDEGCEAHEISERYYYELKARIKKLKLLQDTFKEQVKDFIKKLWIGQKSIKN